MSYRLKSTSLDIVNIPRDTIEELGWKIHDDVHVIIAEEHFGKNNEFTHNTISIERVEDYNKYMEEEE
jgi:hypothetical protein|tara:strand:+ start:316 stop:519 length:204 start_codon:yes stop_codon:yes gene_type:complete